MASMSYCMFENTSIEMLQVVASMEEASDIDSLDLNEYEQDAFRDLFKFCKRYIKEYNRLTEEFR